jgi:hypothetical protein
MPAQEREYDDEAEAELSKLHETDGWGRDS